MTLQLYNTLTRRKEAFTPREPPLVRLYVCGPNLYGPAHVGHGFSYAFFDVLRRYLEYRGFSVLHVQNFTDIEDRIIDRAVREQRSIAEIAQEYVDRFFREIDALGVQRAQHYPRASEMIPTIIDIIRRLLDQGQAYRVNGDVYFRVTSFPRYLRLSGRTMEAMQAGARIEPDPRKEHPMDFALWKAAKPGEPSWPSPWGGGRPGWHIECSAMNLRYLGEQIDIHGGGEDLIFPHHENEIAQSEAYTGRSPFARYWLHNALMKPPVGEEMHRHLGNFVSLEDALSRYEPDAIRLFYLSAHYRTPLRWTDDAVSASARGLERLRIAMANADQALSGVPQEEPDGTSAAADAARGAFEHAMDDDLNTPQALAALFTLAAEVNRLADAVVKGSADAAATAPALRTARDVLRELLGVLGVRLLPRTIREAVTAAVDVSGAATDRHLTAAERHLRAVEQQVRSLAAALAREAAHLFGGEMPDEFDQVVDYIVRGRELARRERDFTTADAIRSRLAEAGILVEDLPTGPRWRIAAPAGHPD